MTEKKKKRNIEVEDPTQVDTKDLVFELAMSNTEFINKHGKAIAINELLRIGLNVSKTKDDEGWEVEVMSDAKLDLQLLSPNEHLAIGLNLGAFVAAMRGLDDNACTSNPKAFLSTICIAFGGK